MDTIYLILVILLLAGCTTMRNDGPYVGYRHNSRPEISNDGWDELCLGNRMAFQDQIETRIGVCKIIRYPGLYAEIQVDYFLIEQTRKQ